MKKNIFIFLCIFLIDCISTPQKINENYISLKYPVIFVHGIVAHDRTDVISFWGRIPSILEEAGIPVFFGNTDAWGNYESNAKILKNSVDAILSETNCEKVNIIAHSKGGIDSRYFIWKYNYGDKVASLTTISTPHRGAEIADYLWEHPMVHTDFSKKFLENFGKIYGDANPDLYNTLFCLTTFNMEKFNKDITLDPNVFFQSIYTTIDSSNIEPFYLSSYRFIERISGENDGVVSEYSASWGNKIFKIDGGISHVDIIDIKQTDISGKNIPDIYLGIVRDLSERGF